MGTSYSSSSAPLRTEYQQFRAPKQNNTALIEPSTQELLTLAQQRHDDFLSKGSKQHEPILKMAGVSQSELMQTARASLIEMARAWTKSYAEQLPAESDKAESDKSCSLILSGHQPDLFHPGVWFKNFALGNLAKSIGGMGIHLIIDSDQCRDVSIRVPTMRNNEPHIESISFDQVQPEMPFEERHVADRDQLNSFPERLKETYDAEHEPLFNKIWPNVVKAVERGKTLGEALSQGRHQIELAHGNGTLELPFSKVCDTEPFRCFVVEILSRIVEFQAAYNGALARYRVAHKLRNAAQPLPDLATLPVAVEPVAVEPDASKEDWIETPFWMWSIDNPQRRALWCQHIENQLLLTDQPDELQTDRWQMPLEIDRPEVAIQQLQACRAEGIKLRSRALTTTLYCRHILADLFLHGIGGAKYDQVTDDLSQQFFGIAPPPHATLTATVRLFDEEPNEPQPAAVSKLQVRLRSYRYHPERWLDEDRGLTEAQQTAMDSKRHWIDTEKTSDNASERHQAIEQANRVLYDSLQSERCAIEQELTRLSISLRRAPYFTSREYSLGLFPEDQLVNRLQSLARNN